jgi:hypothetical protein
MNCPQDPLDLCETSTDNSTLRLFLKYNDVMNNITLPTNYFCHYQAYLTKNESHTMEIYRRNADKEEEEMTVVVRNKDYLKPVYLSNSDLLRKNRLVNRNNHTSKSTLYFRPKKNNP